jgi:hypothetical protein
MRPIPLITSPSKNDFAPKVEIISGHPQVAARKVFCCELAIGRIRGVPK